MKTKKELTEEQKLKTKLYYQKYYQLNKEKYAINYKNYRNTKEGKLALSKAKKKQRDNLTDYYIIQNIIVNLYNQGFSIDRKSITKKQIEVARQSLLIKREYKKCKQKQD